MTTPNLEERTQAYSLALSAITANEPPANPEFVLTALSNLSIRDALLKTLSVGEAYTATVAVSNLFDIGTNAYGEAITDWSPNLLGILAGLSLLQYHPNEAKMYAQAGSEQGNSLSSLILRSLTLMPPTEACRIFTLSMSRVTLDECLAD